jgi:SAM-dependent methyltransferase
MSFCPKKDWFVNWFDSPYYHLLYSHRDYKEAELFLDNLLGQIEVRPNASVLDLGCGKGRHSIYLQGKGFEVTGIDLSVESIEEARKMVDARLNFLVADMRTFSLNRKFDCVMNLFTSFGYFETIEDNLKVIGNVRNHLEPGGLFVLDYFNSACVRKHIPFSTEMFREGVHFSIRKYEEDEFVVKEIKLTDGDHKETFLERVQLLTKEVLCQMLTESGLQVKSTFGDYHLNPFFENESERLIIIAQN